MDRLKIARNNEDLRTENQDKCELRADDKYVAEPLHS